MFYPSYASIPDAATPSFLVLRPAAHRPTVDFTNGKGVS